MLQTQFLKLEILSLKNEQIAECRVSFASILKQPILQGPISYIRKLDSYLPLIDRNAQRKGMLHIVCTLEDLGPEYTPEDEPEEEVWQGSEQRIRDFEGLEPRFLAEAELWKEREEKKFQIQLL